MTALGKNVMIVCMLSWKRGETSGGEQVIFTKEIYHLKKHFGGGSEFSTANSGYKIQEILCLCLCARLSERHNTDQVHRIEGFPTSTFGSLAKFTLAGGALAAFNRSAIFDVAGIFLHPLLLLRRRGTALSREDDECGCSCIFIFMYHGALPSRVLNKCFLGHPLLDRNRRQGLS